MHNTLKHKGKAAKFVDDIFQPAENNLLSVKQNLNNKRRCMAMLLRDYLSEQPIPKLYTCYNHRYNLIKEAHQSFDTLAQQQKPSLLLIAITKSMLTVYDSSSVENLAAFLQGILDEKPQIIKEFGAYRCDFSAIDTQDTYARLRDKIRGSNCG
ncbi:unnamed protein product [Didymodactylos carnosus]|uniref:Uncharacterized protein n=1 Tax=Didymodactylos carnosus TaxID=1234261 RepID=A0A814C0V6_9BILA|nr:unnamed protein product [Didymodactylos carnosus]CAF1063553.1 unnamed protein product [Didymodactylos carnosus]CAF3712648.1 unnamed protein product [Didymodactylos carnosus]CAF3828828.1 unnamed protein product [Didymodactylos carnosus]